MKKIVKILGGLAPAFAAFGIQVAVAAIASFVYTFFKGMEVGFELALEGVTDQSEVMERVMEIALLSPEITYIITVIGSLVCGVVFLFWYRHISKNDKRVILNSVFTPRNTLMFVVMGIGCQLFISGILSIAQQYFEKLFSDYSEVMDAIFSGHLLVVIINTVILAPVVEELIFRGVIMKKMQKAVPFIAANIIQAAIFGIYHGNIVQGIYAFGLGMLLGLTAHKCKTVLASIVLHMMVNSSAFLIMFFPDSKFIYWGFILIGAIAIALSLKRLVAMEQPEVETNRPYSGNEF